MPTPTTVSYTHLDVYKRQKEGSTIYLDPQGSATRAQVAAILSRYAQNIVK